MCSCCCCRRRALPEPDMDNIDEPPDVRAQDPNSDTDTESEPAEACRGDRVGWKKGKATVLLRKGVCRADSHSKVVLLVEDRPLCSAAEDGRVPLCEDCGAV